MKTIKFSIYIFLATGLFFSITNSTYENSVLAEEFKAVAILSFGAISVMNVISLFNIFSDHPHKYRNFLFFLLTLLFSFYSLAFRTIKFQDFKNKQGNISYSIIKEECFKNGYYFLYSCDKEKIRNAYLLRTFQKSVSNDLKKEISLKSNQLIKECMSSNFSKEDCLDLIKESIKN